MSAVAYATPPDCQSFRRGQIVAYTPDESALLRIWVAYVGQGDAILIQFPRRSAPPGGKPAKMLIDGGPRGNQLEVFLRALFPATPETIEYAVLTHHDEDHVQGLSNLLERGAFRVRNLYHNGLATWKLGSRVFRGPDWPPASEAVVETRRSRGMAFFDNPPYFAANGIIKNRDQLLAGLDGFGTVYCGFAKAVQGGNVERFPRTHFGNAEFPASVGPVRLTPLWLTVKARGYGEQPRGAPQWSPSINGNSVVFRLDYNQFSMPFTGDLNEDAETEILATLGRAGRLDALHTDVLKIPHHGSANGIEGFFRQVNPVLSVASMGRKGFGRGWKHPSPQVIRWLGGTDRVYHTYIHERPFDYSTLTEAARSNMKEMKHVLIETDGIRFRFVEVADPALGVPAVELVKRGDGTRWIDAKEQ